MTALSDLLQSLNRRGLSTRQIEAEAEKRGHRLNFATASRYLRGDHPAKPSAQVLAAFAAVFGTDVNRIREAAGQAPTADRFELPPEADMLNPDERRAVTELVRVMARQKKVGEGNAGSPAPMNHAEGNSAISEDDGIGAFGHRDRGDLDHESVNDGTGDNVHRLHPDLETMAAHRPGTESAKQRQLREEAERQDESQDPDDHR